MTEWRNPMQIHPKDASDVRPDRTKPSHSAPIADSHAVGVISATPAGVDRADAVPIDGHALERESWPGTAGLDARRASQIRRRALNGAYHSLEVVDAVARRLLDAGDL
jgi:hypothetical protein